MLLKDLINGQLHLDKKRTTMKIFMYYCNGGENLWMSDGMICQEMYQLLFDSFCLMISD